MNAKSPIFEETAKTIDCRLQDLVEEVVKGSNEKKLLYHGIKRSKNIEDIKREGIKPLTPESGPCSFWSTGLALFHPQMDSPFFNYSGGVSSELYTCELNLAMTYYELLSELNPNIGKYKKDGQMQIKETVPFEAITIFNIKVKYSSDESRSRKHRQVAEQTLLKTIYKEMHKKPQPGKIIKKEIRV